MYIHPNVVLVVSLDSHLCQQQVQHGSRRLRVELSVDATPLPAMDSIASGSAAISHVLCRQRKIKCDKQQPYSNCARAQKECVYSTPAPPRRRKGRVKLSEEQLLRRLRQYEVLLKSYGMKIEDLERLDDNGLKLNTSAIVPSGHINQAKAFSVTEVKQSSLQEGNSGSPVQ